MYSDWSLFVLLLHEKQDAFEHCWTELRFITTWRSKDRAVAYVTTLLGDVGLRIGPTRGLSVDGNISPQRRKKERRNHTSQNKCKQLVKVIWHKAASPPDMDGSVVFFSSRGANVHPIYRKPKMVAMATSLRTSNSAMSSSDSMTPKTHP